MMGKGRWKEKKRGGGGCVRYKVRPQHVLIVITAPEIDVRAGEMQGEYIKEDWYELYPTRHAKARTKFLPPYLHRQATEASQQQQ